MKISEYHINPIVLTNYSQEWTDKYLYNDYLSVDPVVGTVRKTSIPADWKTVVKKTPESRGFFNEAESYGVAPHGITIPFHRRGSGYAMLSVSSFMTDREWEREHSRIFLILAALAPFIDQRVTDLSWQQHFVEKLRVTSRELECLSWFSRGQTPKQIAARLLISDTMVRNHLHGVRIKLGCDTIPEALAIAVKIESIIGHNLETGRIKIENASKAASIPSVPHVDDI